jgi:ribose 5-phosphate isomerase B
MAETIPIGADHAGFALKERIKAELEAIGEAPDDVGTRSPEPADYPEFAHVVADRISRGQAKRGVLICGSGLGMSYAANRHHGVRAAVVWNSEVAKLSRLHNDANVLVLPSRFVSEGEAVEILKVWLNTPFEGGRHERRVAKIDDGALG